MVFAGLIFTMQIFILMAALPVAVMSMQTSRRHRSQQRNFMLIAIMLSVLAFVGMVLTIALVPRSREVEYLLALCLPSATILLSVMPIKRSVQAEKMRTRKRNKGATESTLDTTQDTTLDSVVDPGATVAVDQAAR